MSVFCKKNQPSKKDSDIKLFDIRKGDNSLTKGVNVSAIYNGGSLPSIFSKFFEQTIPILEIWTNPCIFTPLIIELENAISNIVSGSLVRLRGATKKKVLSFLFFAIIIQG